ncbi:MAG: hypothetical protein U0166_10095 [Acidobacteriota bacterium]
MTLSMVFLTCFLVGFFYAIATSFLGLGGHGHDVGHVHDLGHDQGHGHGESSGFSWLSPVVLASFVTVFGGAGFISNRGLGFGSVGSMLMASGMALLVSGGVFMVMDKLFASTQASSEAEMATIVGKEAEVITPIPAGGFGEIAYLCKGSRLTAPARSLIGDPIDRREMVRIDKVSGSTHYVTRIATF